MQPLAQESYTRAEVISALHASNRIIRFSYDLLSSSNAYIGTLDKVISGSVENNSLATQVKRTANITLRDPGEINFLSERIRPNFHIRMPDGGEAKWPLGIFLLNTPVRRFYRGKMIREITAYDQLVTLFEDKVTDRYIIAESVNYITTVKSLLESVGDFSYSIPSDDRLLPVSRDWAPGTDKLRIVNDLLTSINYTPLHFSSNGVAISKPYQSPSDAAPGYTYEVGSKSILFPDLAIEFDLYGIPNKWVTHVSEADRVALSSSYTNINADSPTSTVSRGRTIVDFQTSDLADQASLDAYVAKIAFEASQVYEAIQFQTALMPHHEYAEVIQLTYPGANVGGKYSEHTWSMPLKAGALMSHRVRRVVNV